MSLSYLLTGGVRSGKSSYALNLANESKHPFYIATGWCGDEEMEKRIAKHREERDDRWTTIEEQIDIASALNKAVENGADFILVDCVGAWVTNLLVQDENSSDMTINKNVLSFIEALEKKIPVPLAVVSNEVGMGLVPGNEMGRNFRDNLGFVNQKIASAVDKVIFMVSGLPIEVKGKDI